MPEQVIGLVPLPVLSTIPGPSGEFVPILTWDNFDESEVPNGEG